MLNFILYGLLIWFLYNLIFRFIIPVYRTTKQVKQRFREMHQTMQEQVNPQQKQTNPQPGSGQKPKPATAPGDYIDFEEIK
jgi:hypothetical protein